MRFTVILAVVFASLALSQSQSDRLSTAQAVLERYQAAMGGVESIRKVQSETTRGEIERTGMQGKASFVSYAKPFKSLFRVTRPDGTQTTAGFDGTVSWTIGPGGASIDKSTPLESNRRDADLQYALHQPDYFESLALVGVEDFEGQPCYHLHGITHWRKDNNQFYDVKTGLLAGYRYQSDDASSKPVVAVYSDYKSFGAHLMPTRAATRTAQGSSTFTLVSVTYEPLSDSLFDLPEAVKALIK
jgi:outer membrane lipoprotein-sorting protein